VINVKGAISALRKSSCMVKHEHCSKLTELNFNLVHIFEDRLSEFLNLFREGGADNLEKLCLNGCLLYSMGELVPLFEVLTNENCPKLSYLDLSFSEISNEEMRVFCAQRLFNLVELYLNQCSISEECIQLICELLTDERCKVALLSLESNRSSVFDTRSKSLGMLKILMITM
jgi:Leucine-rich repeat (LRR) protein